MVQGRAMQMFLLRRDRSVIRTAPIRAAIILVCLGALAGCGDIAFKRGSGPDAFAADRQVCQSRNPESAAVRACLSEAGWHVTNLDPAAPPAQRPAVPVQSAPPQSSPSIPAPAPNVQPPTTGPGTLLVGGWWKFGASAADLKSASDACVAALGPSNLPGPGYHIVTRALYICLRSHGWHGLERPAS